MRRAARAVGAWTAGALLLSLVLGAAAVAATLTFPSLTGRVVDQAGILSADTQRQLTGLSAQAEQHGGVQIVVATLKSLQGTTIEDYGYQLGRAWGIGQKGQDNGILLIVAPTERSVRIEVGYGLEGRLTDAQSRVIIETLILPQFKTGDFNAGVLAGASAIMQAVTGAAPSAAVPPAQAVARDDSDDSIVPFVVFILIVMFLGGRGLLWPLLFMGLSGRRGGGFSGGGGFSDGGFSGGGGSFGGGGASGKW